jgi:hypothetical protein
VYGADPDRACFAIALETAREQVINAANVIADTAIDLIGKSAAPSWTTSPPPAACA